MGSLITFAPRPFPAPMAARVQANAAARDAFMATPRGQFVKACSDLVTAGWESTADVAISAYRGAGVGLGFQREDMVPDCRSLGAAIQALTSIPPEYERACAIARRACGALVAIAFPFNDTTNGAA